MSSGFRKFLLLWAGELISSIGGGLTSFGLGIFGFLSQLGYVVAYAVSGLAADILGNATGYGVGRGAALMILLAGVLLSATALTLLRHPGIKELE